MGCTIHAQQLLLAKEDERATPILRELINLAPTLLRATFEAWGYSRYYCLLEQCWLEAYAGMVSASLPSNLNPNHQPSAIVLTRTLALTPS